MNEKTASLPALRKDVVLSEGAPLESGAPSWVIHDPVQHRYFQISHSTFAILKDWQAGLSPAKMASKASELNGEKIDATAIDALAAFLREKGLTEETQSGQWRHLMTQAERKRSSQFRQIASKALFYRIPILRPERMLRVALPYIAPLYSRGAAILVAVITLCGLFMVSQQWTTFVGTFRDFFSLDGIVAFGLSLFFMKVMHELGHAFTALRYGCRVPSMGVAFMMLTPILYTDVTDTWQLKSRNQRMAISAAGVIVELALAGIATFLWVFLEDGTARAIAFTIATSGWATSLLINLNPLLRYDGYFVLSDFLSIDNLKQRADALGRWQMRRFMLAPGLPPPEYLPAGRRNFLVGYAWASWVYRLVIFFTIVMVVDRFSIRAVGVTLFLIGSWFLIIKPVITELGEWCKLDGASLSRKRITMMVSSAVLVGCIFVLPVWTRVEIPAVLTAADLTQIHPIQAARIVTVSATPNTIVNQGEVLFELDVPGLNSEIEKSIVERDLIETLLAQASASSADREQSLVLRRKWMSLQTRIAGLIEQRDQMNLRAPIGGLVLQTASNLHTGRWVHRRETLAVLTSGRDLTVRGYVQASDATRLSLPAKGRFIPDDLTVGAFDVKLESIASVSAENIEIVELASTSGGKIAVQRDENQNLVPVLSHYSVDLTPIDMAAISSQVVRGVVLVDGTPESLAFRLWRNASKILLLESGL